jgi:sulfur-oxidizing protein SoxZ
MKSNIKIGSRKNAAGKIVPLHFIRYGPGKCEDKEALPAQFSLTVPQGPFRAFKFKSARKAIKSRYLARQAQRQAHRFRTIM